MKIKLSPFAFARLFGLHAWTGIVSSLVLYVMFVAGGISLFREQLQVWEEPAAEGRGVPPSLEEIAAKVKAKAGASLDDLWVELPRGGRATRVGFSLNGTWTTGWLGAPGEPLVLAREHLSTFLYGLHFLWHDLTGRTLYVVGGLMAAAMLLALVTGVLVHLRDLRRQLHRLRAEGSRRVLWSDLHKVTGVMGLPFQLVYAYTGALLVLGPLVLKVFAGPVFGGDDRLAASYAVGTPAADAAASALSDGSNLSLDVLRERATALVPGFVPAQVHVVRHGRADGSVTFSSLTGSVPPLNTEVRLRERDGLPLPTPPTTGAPTTMRRWTLGLHLARFGGLPLRFVFLGLALGSALTLLSGNWLWLARRSDSRGQALLRRLTVGLGAGLWVALAALFLASRALPFAWRARGAVEELIFVGTLLACAIWAMRSRAPDALWSHQLGLSSALLLPVACLGREGSGARPAAALAIDGALLLATVGLATAALLLRPRSKHDAPGLTARSGPSRVESHNA